MSIIKDITDIVFIIQARIGSQRVPRKMIKPFAHTTLTDIALEKIKYSKVIPLDNFYLAVYEKELVDIGLKHGTNIFRRSARSAQSEGTPITEIYEWWDRLHYQYCILISACNPFLSIETIDDFVTTYMRTASDGLFGVIAKKNYFWDHEKTLMTPWPSGHKIMNTKFVGITYEAAHCLYAGRMDHIGQGMWMGTFQEKSNPELYVIKEEEALDIDYPWQFEMCEMLYRARKDIAI